MKQTQLFLSAVSAEFTDHRNKLREALDRPGLRVETQESFLELGLPVLTTLDDYIQQCDAVVQIVGKHTGARASKANLAALRLRYPNLSNKLNLSNSLLDQLSYTQWEAWLAILHSRRLFLAPSKDSDADAATHAAACSAVSPSGETCFAVPPSGATCPQALHLENLKFHGHYPSTKLEFQSTDQLIIALLRSLHDFLPLPAIFYSKKFSPSIGGLLKGRDSTLVRIRELLYGNLSASKGMIALSGLGGIGKSRLALEFASISSAQYSAVFVVSAFNREIFEQDLADFASLLALPEQHQVNPIERINTVKRWLSANNRWILIIENVDTDAALQQLDMYAGAFRNGHVIATGRIASWPSYFDVIPLEKISSDDAIELLFDYTDQYRATEASALNDRQYAQEIAKVMDGLPLALVQAGSHIKKRRISFANYLQGWHEERDAMLSDNLFDPVRIGYPLNLAVTWKMTYEQLPVESARLFDALCYLAPDSFPERLIAQPWSDAAAAFMRQSGATLPDQPLDLLLPLFEYCLVNAPQTSTRILSMHPLVQEVGRFWQRQQPPALSHAPISLLSELLATNIDRPNTLANLSLNVVASRRDVFRHLVFQLSDAEIASKLSGEKKWTFATELSETFLAEGQSQQAITYAQLAVITAKKLNVQALIP